MGCVLRTAGSSIIFCYANPLTSLELLNYYLTLAMSNINRVPIFQDPDDLPFKKGEMLTVVSKDEEQWWTARKQFFSILFPSSVVLRCLSVYGQFVYPILLYQERQLYYKKCGFSLSLGQKGTGIALFIFDLYLRNKAFKGKFYRIQNIILVFYVLYFTSF